MVPTSRRLHSRADFARASRQGRRVGGRYVVVSVAVTADSWPAKVGFAVSRRVGGSVTRNLVTRRLRHLTRPMLDELPTGTLVLVRALPAAAGARFRELEADVARALHTARKRSQPRPDRPERSERVVGYPSPPS
jgi:ribonuclease P protein component